MELSLRQTFSIFLTACIIFVCFALTLTENISLEMGTLGILFALFLGTFFFSPFSAFLLLIFTRPLVDNFGDALTFSLGDFTLNATGILGILAIFLGFSYLVAYGKDSRIKKHPITLFLCIFFAIASLSITSSMDFGESIRETVRILSLITVFLVSFVFIEQNTKRFFPLLLALAFSAILPVLVGWYQIITDTGLTGTFGVDSRVYGTFSHPNPYAAYLIVIFAILLFFFLTQKTFRKTILFSLGTLFALLVLTYSRGALLSLLVFLILLSIRQSVKYLFGIGMILIVLFFTVTPFHDRIEDIYNPPLTSSVYWRLEQWSRVWQLIIDKPLLGYGIGTEIPLYEKEYGNVSGNPYTHNDPLKITEETGIIGFVAFLAIHIAFLASFLFGFLRSRDTELRTLFSVVSSLYLAILAFSMSSNIWHSTALMWALWSLSAASLAYAIAKKKIS